MGMVRKRTRIATNDKGSALRQDRMIYARRSVGSKAGGRCLGLEDEKYKHEENEEKSLTERNTIGTTKNNQILSQPCHRIAELR